MLSSSFAMKVSANQAGQTYFAHEAPESQHHTNQRFFGGKKNIAGFFFTADSFNHPLAAVYPAQIHSVQIKGHSLFDINKIPLQKAMEFEIQGSGRRPHKRHSCCALRLTGFSAREIGALLAFWELYAVYSSVLRDVDPFNQPQVENSKKISFDKRLGYKGLL